jgi:hypothetical protein
MTDARLRRSRARDGAAAAVSLEDRLFAIRASERRDRRGPVKETAVPERSEHSALQAIPWLGAGSPRRPCRELVAVALSGALPSWGRQRRQRQPARSRPCHPSAPRGRRSRCERPCHRRRQAHASAPRRGHASCRRGWRWSARRARRHRSPQPRAAPPPRLQQPSPTALPCAQLCAQQQGHHSKTPVPVHGFEP